MKFAKDSQNISAIQYIIACLWPNLVLHFDGQYGWCALYSTTSTNECTKAQHPPCHEFMVDRPCLEAWPMATHETLHVLTTNYNVHVHISSTQATYNVENTHVCLLQENGQLYVWLSIEGVPICKSRSGFRTNQTFWPLSALSTWQYFQDEQTLQRWDVI